MAKTTVQPPADITEARRVRIEQALACGNSHGFIAHTLRVPRRHVQRVARYLEDVNAEPEVIPHPRSAEAGAEQAAIYGHAIHDGTAHRLPRSSTEWERRRLQTAARKLRGDTHRTARDTA